MIVLACEAPSGKTLYYSYFNAGKIVYTEKVWAALRFPTMEAALDWLDSASADRKQAIHDYGYFLRSVK